MPGRPLCPKFPLASFAYYAILAIICWGMASSTFLKFIRYAPLPHCIFDILQFDALYYTILEQIAILFLQKITKLEQIPNHFWTFLLFVRLFRFGFCLFLLRIGCRRSVSGNRGVRRKHLLCCRLLSNLLLRSLISSVHPLLVSRSRSERLALIDLSTHSCILGLDNVLGKLELGQRLVVVSAPVSILVLTVDLVANDHHRTLCCSS